VFASTADRETALSRGRVTLFGRACTLAEGGGGGGEGRPLSSVEGRGGAATAVEVLLESALTVRAAHPSRGGMGLAPPPRPAPPRAPCGTSPCGRWLWSMTGFEGDQRGRRLTIGGSCVIDYRWPAHVWFAGAAGGGAARRAIGWQPGRGRAPPCAGEADRCSLPPGRGLVGPATAGFGVSISAWVPASPAIHPLYWVAVPRGLHPLRPNRAVGVGRWRQPLLPSI
jgi:hypothetical protein